MAEQIHFIGKQKLYFDFSTAKSASLWNAGTAAFHQHEIVPVLNQIFDELLPPDLWLSVPSIEVDLGNVSLREFKDELYKQVTIVVREALGSNKPVGEHDEVGQSLQRNGLQVKLHHQRLHEVFYTFLDHGILPWNSDIHNISVLEQQLVNEFGIDVIVRHRDFASRMAKTAIRQRLLNQFTRPFVKTLFNKFYTKATAQIRHFRKRMINLLKGVPVETEFKMHIALILREDILHWIARAENTNEGNLSRIIIGQVINRMVMASASAPADSRRAILMALFSTNVSGRKTAVGNDVVRLIEEATSHINYNTNFYEQSSSIASDHSMMAGKSAISSEDASTGVCKPTASEPLNDPKEHHHLSQNDPATKKSTHDALVFNIDQPVVSGIDQTAKSKGGSKIAEGVLKSGKVIPAGKQIVPEGHSDHRDRDGQSDQLNRGKLPTSLQEYYVVNAGLVLCWPYLKQLFDLTGYLLSNNFNTEELRERAVHLLGYIATGREECGEHELTMAKFITAWPLHIPVVKKLRLTKNEKEHADTMLEHVITNWQVLKNTSMEGLRTSFLMRNGKLIREENGWKLIVEQKPFDMLLDHLPYSIAMIKLAWLKDIFRVDWA